MLFLFECILTLFDHLLFVPNLYAFIFFCWTQNKILWRIFQSILQLMVAINFHRMENKIQWKSMATVNYLISVVQKKSRVVNLCFVLYFKILVKSMLRKRSFSNPFEFPSRRQGRSMSAPGVLTLWVQNAHHCILLNTDAHNTCDFTDTDILFFFLSIISAGICCSFAL